MTSACTLAARIEAAEAELIEAEDDQHYYHTCLHLPASHPDYQDRRRLPGILRRLRRAQDNLTQLRQMAHAQPAITLTRRHGAIAHASP